MPLRDLNRIRIGTATVLVIVRHKVEKTYVDPHPYPTKPKESNATHQGLVAEIGRNDVPWQMEVIYIRLIEVLHNSANSGHEKGLMQAVDPLCNSYCSRKYIDTFVKIWFVFTQFICSKRNYNSKLS